MGHVVVVMFQLKQASFYPKHSMYGIFAYIEVLWGINLSTTLWARTKRGAVSFRAWGHDGSRNLVGADVLSHAVAPRSTDSLSFPLTEEA